MSSNTFPVDNNYTITVQPSQNGYYINGNLTYPAGWMTSSGGNSGGYGTTTTTGTNTFGPYVNSPITFGVQADVTTLMTLQTSHGELKILRDGTVEYPTTMDDGAKEFWDYVAKAAQAMIWAEVRKLAAQKVRELLPDMLPPGVNEYEKATIPVGIAVAIEG